MSPGTTALSIIFGIVAVGSCLGFLAANRGELNLEEWAVAGRGLGLILVGILLAGETFTAYSVLGISGWIYSKGGPTLYVLAYTTLGQIFVFFLGPTLWEVGRRFDLQTLGDFFARLTHSWFISTVLVNSLLFAWPHFFSSIFTAKNGDAVRRNSMIMPFYVMPLLLIIFAGCAAILISPGLANGDLALLTAVRATFPPWLLGTIGGAGALTAMVPAAIQILNGSTLFAKNVYRPFFAPTLSDEKIGGVARIAVGGITVVALYLSLHSSTTLVGLLILAYSGVAQFAPGIVLGLYSRRVTGKGVLSGLLTGLAIAGCLTFTHRDPFLGFNAGFWGLIGNLLVLSAVSCLTAQEANGFDLPEGTARAPG